MSTLFIGTGNVGAEPEFKEFPQGNDAPRKMLRLNIRFDNPVPGKEGYQVGKITRVALCLSRLLTILNLLRLILLNLLLKRSGRIINKHIRIMMSIIKIFFNKI